MEQPLSEVTRILRDLGDSPEAREELLPLVYSELKAIAQRRMAEERQGHTLQATVLVQEAYMRLVGPQDFPWESRGCFFAAAAEAMRRILVDHARRQQVDASSETVQNVRLEGMELAGSGTVDVVALSEALDKLQEEDVRSAEVVRLRFFAGLSVEETASALDVPPRTVSREWSFARARLFQLLSSDQPPDADTDQIVTE